MRLYVKPKKKSRKPNVKQRNPGKRSDGDHKPEKPRVFVVDFVGDIRASASDALAEQVTAILTQATQKDEVVVRLESSGGMVHSYGLASSQLQRIRDKAIPLTVCVDKVAASGGYMMACIANQILAAPFAVIGSIGVVAQVPNINRLLKKHDIDVEMLTAGEYKRTLTVLGENTEKGRQKFQQEIQETHELFKEFVSQNRAGLDMDVVATGEVWFGTKALENGLVDIVKTSDDYLFQRHTEADIYKVDWVEKHSLSERLGLAAESAMGRILVKFFTEIENRNIFPH
jgi:serine protease SohB